MVLSIPALIVGNQALTKIKQDPTLQGEGLARAGVILGWIGVGLRMELFVDPQWVVTSPVRSISRVSLRQ